MTGPLGQLDEIRRVQNGAALRLTFSSGAVVELTARELWRECRSAEGVLRRLNETAPSEHLFITALQPVGDYAINIAFSDGEQRGIYPFSLLSRLAGTALDGARTAA